MQSKSESLVRELSLALQIPPHKLIHEDPQDLMFDAIALGILTTGKRAKEAEIENLAHISPAYQRILQRIFDARSLKI
ncbi:MAG: hypothetical protein HYU02_05070 [Thaumarchaeota archaeon]|nr:hypothetical protein [Nitrososphaerota archaeon]